MIQAGGAMSGSTHLSFQIAQSALTGVLGHKHAALA